jgi:hypothetical protein
VETQRRIESCELSGSHGGDYEVQSLLGCTAVFSETSIDIQLRTRQYIPEDSELGVESCSKNLKERNHLDNLHVDRNPVHAFIPHLLLFTLILFFHIFLGLVTVSFLQGFQLDFCMNFSRLVCVLQASPISSSFIYHCNI